jgi:hypothetical protein
VAGWFEYRALTKLPAPSLQRFSKFSPFHILVFGINNLCSGEIPYVYAKPLCLGPSVQLLCNRYFALNTQKMITITKAC